MSRKYGRCSPVEIFKICNVCCSRIRATVRALVFRNIVQVHSGSVCRALPLSSNSGGSRRIIRSWNAVPHEMLSMEASEREELALRQFTKACERWATGKGDWRDEAAVLAVSAGAPMPRELQPDEYGLDHRGLVPDERLPAYKTAKDNARKHFHERQARNASDALDEVLCCSTANYDMRDAPCDIFRVFVDELRKASLLDSPVVLGLASAIRSGIGLETCTGWSVSRLQLLSLGSLAASLSRWLIYDGWSVESAGGDDYAELLWRAPSSLCDAEMRQVVHALNARRTLARARRNGIQPVGTTTFTSVTRSRDARANCLLRVWWLASDALLGKFSSGWSTPQRKRHAPSVNNCSRCKRRRGNEN